MKKLAPNTTSADQWSTTKSGLQDAANEQTSADIALAESVRNLRSAQLAQSKALARKQSAEKRLQAIRGSLESDS